MNLSVFRTIIYCIGLVALFGLLNADFIVAYLVIPVVTGWDGAVHQAAAQLYADTIYPSMWGWIPYWYGGMPFPQFYPPFFYFFLATLYKVFSFVDSKLLFKIVTLALTALVPIIAYLVSWSWSKKRVIACLSGIVTVLFISSTDIFAQQGITLSASIHSGTVPHLFAFVLLYIWYWLFVSSSQSHLKTIAAIACFAGVMLTNIHVVPVLIFFLITSLCFDLFVDKKNIYLVCKNLLIHGGIPFLVGAMWYVPMIVFSDYTSARALTFTWYEFMQDLEKCCQHLYFVSLACSMP